MSPLHDTNDTLGRAPHPDPLHVDNDDDDDADEFIGVNRGLLSNKPIRLFHGFTTSRRPKDWQRPYWLGLALFMALFAFWILDSLKDPILGALTNGNLERHQPPAKLVSVGTTLLLVCFMEYVLQARQKEQELKQQRRIQQGGSNNNNHITAADDDDDDDDGPWQHMDISSAAHHEDDDQLAMATSRIMRDDYRYNGSLFIAVGVSYCIFFGIMANLLQFHVEMATMNGSSSSSSNDALPAGSQQNGLTFWHLTGYIMFAAIESFGSISVAVFWSYVNSTLCLPDAERFYGVIVAMAQLGAIGGSSCVTAHIWNKVTLIVLACLVILLHILVMVQYCRTFAPTSRIMAATAVADADASDHHVVVPPTTTTTPLSIFRQEQPRRSVTFRDDDDDNARDRRRNSLYNNDEPNLWSGVYLILRHNYVLLILGVSCLYEVSLTCLNYQMTLLGWARFEADNSQHKGMNFTQFMGMYGQVVNFLSLVLSSMVFPILMQRFGLRRTLRLFPTLLLLANVVAFGAVPGNLTVLFSSMAVLKALTYSVHDPSKEILYIPTSNAIKLKAKFWIDVVGARVAKAIGSSINNYAGSVDRSVRVASAPSLLTAAALWYTCYRCGHQFEHLVDTDTIVGGVAAASSDRGMMSQDDYGELKILEEDDYYSGHDDDDAEDFDDPRSAMPAAVELTSG